MIYSELLCPVLQSVHNNKKWILINIFVKIKLQKSKKTTEQINLITDYQKKFLNKLLPLKIY